MKSSTTTNKHSRRTRLQRQLYKIYTQWRCQKALHGMARSITLATLILVPAIIIDALLPLTFKMRLGLTLVLYGALALDAWKSWLREILRPYSARRAAWLLEQNIPELDEKLITAVELGEERYHSLSNAMISRLRNEADFDLRKIQGKNVFALPLRHAIWAFTAVAAFLLLGTIPSLHLTTRLNRVLLPSMHDPVMDGRVKVQLRNPRGGRFPENETVQFYAKVSSPSPIKEPVYLCVQTTQPARYIMQSTDQTELYKYNLTISDQDASVYVEVGNARSRAYPIQTTPRPRVTQFRIQYHYPDYTNKAARQTVRSTADISAVKGTDITLAASFSKPLATAALQLGETKIAGHLDESKTAASFNFSVNRTSAIELLPIDADGLKPSRRLIYRLRTIPDNKPKIKLVKPTHDLNAGIDEQIDFRWSSSDDYGIARQSIHIRKPDQSLLLTQKLPADSKSWSLDLSKLNLDPGQVISVTIEAADKKQQSVVSTPLTIVLTAQRSITDTTQVLKVLTTLSEIVESTVETSRHLWMMLQTARNVNRPWKIADNHLTKIIDIQKSRLRTQLREAHQTCEQLKMHGQFRQTRRSAILIQQAIEEQLLVNLPAIQKSAVEDYPVTLKSARSLQQTLDTIHEHAQALTVKAVEQKAAKELPLLLQAFRHINKLPRNEKAQLVHTAIGNAHRLWEGYGLTPPSPFEELPDKIPPRQVPAAANKTREILRQIHARIRKSVQDTAMIDQSLDRLVRLINQPLERLQAFNKKAVETTEASKHYWTLLRQSGEAFIQKYQMPALQQQYDDDCLIGEALTYAADRQDTSVAATVIEQAIKIRRHQLIQATYNIAAELHANLLQTMMAAANVPAETRHASNPDESERLRQALGMTAMVSAECTAFDLLKFNAIPADVNARITRDAEEIQTTLKKLLHKNTGSELHPHTKELKAATATADNISAQLADAIRNQQVDLRRARKILQQYSPRLSTRLQTAEVEFYQTAQALQSPQPDFAKAVPYLQEQKNILKRISQRLKNRARNRVRLPHGDLLSSAEELMLSHLCQSLCKDYIDHTVSRLQMVMVNNTQHENSSAASDNPPKPHPAVTQTIQKLAAAERALRRSCEFAKAYEENQNGQMPWAEHLKTLKELQRSVASDYSQKLKLAMNILHNLQIAEQTIAHELDGEARIQDEKSKVTREELFDLSQAISNIFLHPQSGTKIAGAARQMETALQKLMNNKQPLDISGQTPENEIIQQALTSIRQLKTLSLQATLAGGVNKISATEEKFAEFQRSLQEITSQTLRELKKYPQFPATRAIQQNLQHYSDAVALRQWQAAYSISITLQHDLRQLQTYPRYTATPLFRTAIGAKDEEPAERAVGDFRYENLRQPIAKDIMQNALNAIDDQEFEAAADKLSLIDDRVPPNIREVVNQAVDAVHTVVRGATLDAYEYPVDSTAHQALEQAARHIALGEFDKAAKQAFKAGAAGSKALAAIPRLEELGQQAARQLQHLIRITPGNLVPPWQSAENAIPQAEPVSPPAGTDKDKTTYSRRQIVDQLRKTNAITRAATLAEISDASSTTHPSPAVAETRETLADKPTHILEPWTGIRKILEQQAAGQLVTPYDTYFRDANREYLKRLAQESKRWIR